MSEIIQKLVIVTCRGKCGGRYIKVSPDIRDRWEKNPESFKCVLCDPTDGVIRSFKHYLKCGGCNQITDPYVTDVRNKCYCKDVQPKLTIVNDPQNKFGGNKDRRIEKIQNEIEANKNEWKFKKSGYKAKQEAYAREVRMDKNMERIADKLDPDGKDKEMRSPV